jgi:large repetitive protein
MYFGEKYLFCCTDEKKMTRREKRNRFSRWLLELFNFSKTGTQPRRILVEPLEKREVFAVDAFLGLLGSAYSIAADTSQQSVFESSSTDSELVGEGEAANDLVAFAKYLNDTGFIFYGADWCPHCRDQRALFEDGAKYLPFVETTNPDRTSNQVGIDEEITSYPTWDFGNGKANRFAGQMTLAQLEAKVRELRDPNFTIPKSSTPFIAELPTVSVGIGSPLMVPIDGYDPNGNPLTVSVTSSNPSLIAATVLTGNRSWRLNTSFGDMTFQLFDDKAPRPTSRIAELTNSGFYNGITFHRVEQGFVLQAGDPLANGTGGSTLADFDDQFNVDLQHNRTGVLSYAKSSDDTNDSQFFITAAATRSLDFNHSIFGQMTEGDAVRQAINRTKTSTISSGSSSFQKPDVAININSASIFTDSENGIVQLKPTGTGTGSATITVTVTDSEGLSTSRSFTANVVQDTSNSSPFLNDIAVVNATTGTPVNITLTSQDAEGDTPTYSVTPLGSLPSNNISVNSSTGVVTVTPPAGFTGQLQFRASVSQAGVLNAPTDQQLVTVLVGGSAPTSVDLATTSDSGASSTDNITSANVLAFTVNGTTAGAIVKLKAGGNVVGQATATGTTTTVNVTNPASLGQGAILFTATQTVDSQESSDSPSLAVTYDTTAPTALPSSVFPSSVQATQAVNLNLAHSEEGSGLTYGATNAPDGLSIDSNTGVVSWTPSTAQIGAQTFTLSLTDAAGNATNQQVSLTVAGQPRVGMTLQVVDTNGAPITTIAAGQNFKVQIFVQDLRSGTSAKGLFSAFADLLFDSNIMEPIAASPISHGTNYTTATTGDTLTAGVIDEVGGIYKDAFGSLNSDSLLLAEVTFRAKASGNPNLRLDAPDKSISDILLFQDASNAEVPVSEVSFGSSSFAVGVNFQLVNDTVNFDEDSGAKVINPLSNDTVTGNAVLTIISVGTSSGGGTVTIAGTGTSLNYLSATNFTGAETFSYTARNQDGVQQTATVTVQVTDVNDPPVAVNDTFNVFSNSTQNVFEVLSNDTKGADTGATETLTVTAVSAGSQGGTISIGSSGLSLRYTPRTGFTGPTETFTYTLSDGRGGTATGTVSVNVTQENPPPTAVADNFAVVEDAEQATFNPLANDSTSDAGETLAIASVGSSANGSQVSVSAGGLTVIYKPALNFAGTEVITYVLQDNRGATAAGQMTFTVSGVNDAPDAVNDAVTVQTSITTSTISVLTNDVNPDTGETLTISAVTQPPTGNGTIAISADSKSLIYTSPSTSFEGTFSFTYTLSDGSSLTDTATVNVTAASFTPRTIGGELIVGTGSTSGSNGVGGLTLQLLGTDYANQPVSATATVAPDGSFAYDNLAPGSYTIQRAALPFLHDSATSIQVSSAADSGNQLNNTIQVGGLMPAYFDIRDFLGSTPKDSLTVALNSDGTQSWYATQGQWAGLKSVAVKSNSSGDSLVVDITNGSSANLTGSVPLANTTRVMQLGQQSSMRLLRIMGSPTEVGITTTAPTTNIPTEPPNASSSDRTVGANGTNPATALTTTASGLQYAILRDSSGVKANSNTSSVTVDYKGWLDNGTIFDSSYARSTQSTFALNSVIAGWTEGLKLVGQGGKIQLRIPPSLGYGSTANNNIPANSTLNFIVEVTSVTNPASGEGELIAEGEAGVSIGDFTSNCPGG